MNGLCVCRARCAGWNVLPCNRALVSLNERGLSVPLMLCISYYSAEAPPHTGFSVTKPRICGLRGIAAPSQREAAEPSVILHPLTQIQLTIRLTYGSSVWVSPICNGFPQIRNPGSHGFHISILIMDPSNRKTPH
jgi:hypothetical protein